MPSEYTIHVGHDGMSDALLIAEYARRTCG